MDLLSPTLQTAMGKHGVRVGLHDSHHTRTRALPYFLLSCLTEYYISMCKRPHIHRWTATSYSNLEVCDITVREGGEAVVRFAPKAVS